MNDEKIFTEYGYRKVLFDAECCIYMRDGEVNIPDLICALWKSTPHLPSLMGAFQIVAARRAARFRVWSYMENDHETQKLAMLSFPSDELTKSLESIFRAAKLPITWVHQAMSSPDWQHLMALVDENKRLYALKQVKRHIDITAKRLDKVAMDEFIAQYPEYKYVANAISKIPRVESDEE